MSDFFFKPLFYRFFNHLVMVPKLGEILGKRGFVAVPNDALNYVTEIVNDILRRRRGKLERRNDFIQIMVDHEQESAETSDADMTNRSNCSGHLFMSLQRRIPIDYLSSQ